MASVIAEGLYFCVDCTQLAANGTLPEDESAARACEAGRDRLGGYPVNTCAPDSAEGCIEFTWSACDCCGSRLGGERHRFDVLSA